MDRAIQDPLLKERANTSISRMRTPRAADVARQMRRMRSARDRR